MKHCSIRIILGLVNQYNLELEQLDVKTAFHHGNLKETIYMNQPEGFEEGENKVCLLKILVWTKVKPSNVVYEI